MSRQEERLSEQKEEIVRLQAEAAQVDSIEQECDVLTQELSLYGERYSIYQIRYSCRMDGSGSSIDLHLGKFYPVYPDLNISIPLPRISDPDPYQRI